MKISVVMPAYNSEATLASSINSVLNQSGAKIELIVIDDGSTDSTAKILSQYGNRIVFRSIPNGGVANARNVGIGLATGDYIMFVDSDDILKENAIAAISDIIEKTNADVIRFGYVISHNGGAQHLPNDRFDKDEFILKEQFKNKIYPHFINGIRLNSMCVTASKRSLFEGIYINTNMKTAEDAYLMTDIYTKAQSVFVVQTPLYIYNRHIGSLTSSGLSVLSKYLCNIKLSFKIASLLPKWHMASIKWYFKTFIRPIYLTFDKLKRIRYGE